MDSFGSRLRKERERRQIALKSIAESTKIGITLLEGLEHDDVSRWPSGIFRKCFIRSYAEAVGLDPDPIVREFLERYPDPLDVEIPAPVVAPRSLPPGTGTSPVAATPPSSASPLAIKLTITWSGSMYHTFGRWADRRSRRSTGWTTLIRKLRSLVSSSAQSGVTPHEEVPRA